MAGCLIVCLHDGSPHASLSGWIDVGKRPLSRIQARKQPIHNLTKGIAPRPRTAGAQGLRRILAVWWLPISDAPHVLRQNWLDQCKFFWQGKDFRRIQRLGKTVLLVSIFLFLFLCPKRKTKKNMLFLLPSLLLLFMERKSIAALFC